MGAGQFQWQISLPILHAVNLGRNGPCKSAVRSAPRSVLGSAVAAAVFIGAQGSFAAEPAQPQNEVEGKTSQEGTSLPAITVTGRVDSAVTEGTGSYTTGETAAATHLPLSLQEHHRR